VFDAWGHPLRFVHPAFKGTIYGTRGSSGNSPDQPTDVSAVLGNAPPGTQYICAQIRRNKTTDGGGPDSDGGIPPTTRPYFYSAGPDGDPSTQDDNIYIAKPKAQR
jgi:hypothetical protein